MAESKLATRFEIQKYKRGDNFPIWKKTIITELRAVKIWKYLKPNNPIAIPAPESQDYASYECADIDGMRILQRSMDGKLKGILLRCESSKEMWETILASFERANSNQKLTNIFFLN